MINLEQIRILEQKVNNAVSVIARLKEENKALRATLENSQSKMTELESLINSFKNDQEEIETGILDVLDKLDRLEDETLEPEPPKKTTEKKKAAPAKDITLKKEPVKEEKIEKTVILNDDDADKNEDEDDEIDFSIDTSDIETEESVDVESSSEQKQDELDIF